jgi:C_GCAxxG_C_C family probable redox protein
MSKDSEAAVAMFAEGYNCAQAVAATCGAACGLDRRTAVQVAQAFGGGMGRTGGVCGAVTGALMVIGLAYSAKDAKDVAAKQKSARLAREVMDRFKARHGSINCRDLLGCDIRTEEGHREAVEKGLMKTVCPKAVGNAAEIVEQVLLEERKHEA